MKHRHHPRTAKRRRNRACSLWAMAGLMGLGSHLAAPAGHGSALVYEGFDAGTVGSNLNGLAGMSSYGWAAGSTWTGETAGDQNVKLVTGRQFSHLAAGRCRSHWLAAAPGTRQSSERKGLRS